MLHSSNTQKLSTESRIPQDTSRWSTVYSIVPLGNPLGLVKGCRFKSSFFSEAFFQNNCIYSRSDSLVSRCPFNRSHLRRTHGPPPIPSQLQQKNLLHTWMLQSLTMGYWQHQQNPTALTKKSQRYKGDPYLVSIWFFSVWQHFDHDGYMLNLGSTHVVLISFCRQSFPFRHTCLPANAN